MKALFFQKNYNNLMIIGILIASSGLEQLFTTNHWFHGLTMIIFGVLIYAVFMVEPSETVTEPTPVPLPVAPPVHASLLPIEWDKQFDEPVATIPPTFFAKLHQPDVRL